MANYIGNEPLAGEFKRLDSIESQFNGSLTSFNLQYNSLTTSAGDASTLFVSLNGVIQEPLEAYTLSHGGSKVVFSSAPAAGDECYIVQMGAVGGTATPSDTSVTHGKLDATVGAIVPSSLGTAGQVLTVNSGATAATFADAGGGASEYTIDNKTLAYTVVSGDLGKILNYTSGTVDVTLTALSSLTTGFHVSIWNSGTGVISIKPNSVDGIGVSAGNDYDSTDPLKLEMGTGVTLVNSGTYWQIYSEKAYDYYHHSVTLGANAKVTNNNAIALGNRSYAASVGSIAIGTGQGHATTASNQHTVAIGLATASGSGATAIGKSRASGVYSFAASINSNTTSYGATGTTSIAMGQYAKAGSSGTAIGSAFAYADGSQSVAIGRNVYANHQSSMALGYGAISDVQGKFVYAGYTNASNGDSQFGLCTLRVSTTDATETTMRTASPTSGVIATTQMTLPNNSAHTFSGTIVAREKASEGTDVGAWEVKGIIRREANAGTTVLVNSVINELNVPTGWAVSLTADTTLGCLKLAVTGVASTNIRWVATIQTSEVTYA